MEIRIIDRNTEDTIYTNNEIAPEGDMNQVSAQRDNYCKLAWQIAMAEGFIDSNTDWEDFRYEFGEAL